MPNPHDRHRLDDPLRESRRAVADGRFADALGLLDLVPPAVQATPDAQLLIAMSRWRLGEFARSRTAALEARAGFRARGDSDGEMRAENVAAAGAFALGDLAEAERGFNRAMELAARRADDLIGARCAVNLGNIAYYREQTEHALSFYRLALAQFERVAYLPGLAEGWLNTAIVLHDAGRLDDSLDASERAVAVAERAGNERLLGQALAARSETDVAAGDVDLGLALAEQALALAQAHGHVMGQADALRIVSIVARRRGNADRALESARRAVEIAVAVNDPWRRGEAHRELGSVYELLGRTQDAVDAFLAAAAAFEQLGAAGRATQLRERAAALDETP
jgi:tetratricopeptide (TPR) repeat protein